MLTQLSRSSRSSGCNDLSGIGSKIAAKKPSKGIWHLNQSTNGFIGRHFGMSTNKIVPADYNGDSKTDVAVHRSGIWRLQRSSLGFISVVFGDVNDIPTMADYDGGGKSEIAVFRTSNSL